ncbi:MAG TPA: GNAT family N-acetyltransferase [Thermoanaerobaculia bacterium]|jgi:GNAT superfamily N-acetyltransferase
MFLRTATPEETGWINEQYAKVHFIPSDPANETIVIAELDGVRAGIGRLVDAGDGACELGGMFVFDEFRGRGVARAIVDELIRRADGRTVYCIPFAELEPLYAAAGFRRIEPVGVPRKVEEKLKWCAREIGGRAVILMKLATPAG